MNENLIQIICQFNPWIKNSKRPIFNSSDYIERLQTDDLLHSEWDKLWLILLGPRQSGKTTLALHLCQKLVNQGRFRQLLFLNCDSRRIRDWLKDVNFIQQAMEQFSLSKPIVFIDEIQRLESPGLLLKAIADLKLPIKMIASGSSQLEIKSQVQEYLTGRQLESVVLPFSFSEIGNVNEANMLYGCYPQVVLGEQKQRLLQQLYQSYIKKDIVEILKIGKPDVMEKLLILIARASGQLVNYNQLANDCGVSVTTVKNYLSILEQTYVIKSIKPFVGNKRKEIVSNPIYYFIDNGFRNQALRNFSIVEGRTDIGLLVESVVFQEILKLKAQRSLDVDIYFWRTQSGAEIDFVLYKNADTLIPIEVKYQHITKATLTRAFHSFIEAYQPKQAIFVTKDFSTKVEVKGCMVHFMPFSQLGGLGSELCRFLQ